MTDIRKYTSYEEASGFMIDCRAEDLAAARNTIFELFKGAGIETVTVQFDGCGDEGQIVEIHVTGGCAALPEGNIETPNTAMEFEYAEDTIRRAVNSYNVARSTRSESPRALLEELCYDLLDIKHSYWGDGEGAYGDLTFQVSSKTIDVDFNERFIDATNQNYEI